MGGEKKQILILVLEVLILSSTVSFILYTHVTILIKFWLLQKTKFTNFVFVGCVVNL